MRIVRARIFGFGKWVDQEFAFPEKGPFFIYGENESGKTTLHQFILFMLFGLPPKQREFYQPKTSSKMGGQLVLRDHEQGEFTIERFDEKNNGTATCYTASGELFDEAWLKDRLRGMNKGTYEAIFSFSALDLVDIREMDEKDLGEVLLSIGLTGSNHIHQIERQLNTRLGELFKPTGKNPMINEQLRKLQELSEELTQYRKEEASYREKMAEADRLAELLESLQKQRQQLEEENHFVTKQLTVLPVIQEYQFLQNKQKDYLKEISFPENGVERLEKLKEEQRPLESEYAVLISNKAGHHKKVTLLKEEQLDGSLVEELQEKQETASVYFSTQKQLEDLRAQKVQSEQEINEELNYLHIDMNKTDLMELSLPFYQEEAWKQLKAEKEKLAFEERDIEAEKRALLEEENYLKHQIIDEEKALLPNQYVEKIKTKLDQNKESEQLHRLYEASIKRNQNFKQEKADKLKRANHILAAGAILFILSLAFGFYMNESFLYSLSILFLLLGIGQSSFTKQHVKQLESMLETPIDMEEKSSLSQAEIFEMETALEKDQKRHAEINRLNTELQSMHIKLLKWDEKQRLFGERKSRLHQQVDEQYTLYPFLQQIDVNFWPEYYQRLRTLLKWNEEYLQLKTEISILETEQEQTRERIFTFIQNHFPNIAMRGMKDTFEWMKERLDEQQLLEQRMNHYEELLAETDENISEMKKRLDVYQKEIEDLFSVANTDSEEDFYKLANKVAERERLEEALELNERQLNAFFPDKSWSFFVNDSLDEVELKRYKEELDEKLKNVHEKLERGRGEIAEITVELNRLEGSEAYSEKMHQLEIEKEKLNQLAKEWSVLKIEKEVLAETKQNYRERYLSKIMEETADFFSTVTEAKYVTVHAPENKEPFLVLSTEGIRYSVNELSQGTMNQLYVALRLAISKVMTKNHQLPFILDDVFVHFDEDRINRMTEVLRQIGENQQVIMFTCKRDVLEAGEALQLPVLNLQHLEKSMMS